MDIPMRAIDSETIEKEELIRPPYEDVIHPVSCKLIKYVLLLHLNLQVVLLD